MNNDHKSLVVWILVLITVVGSAAAFLFTLPDFSKSERTNYGDSGPGFTVTESTTEPTSIQSTKPTTLKTAKETVTSTKRTTTTTKETVTTTIIQTTSTTVATTTKIVVVFPLNINTATKEELMEISGIGEVYASRIIAYREENNGFTSLDELLNIKGIGEKRLAAFKEYLYCE